MKKTLDRYFLIVLIFFLVGGPIRPSRGQSFEIMQIGESGCSAAFPSIPKWNSSIKDDGTKTWSGSVTVDGTKYGILCMEFPEPMTVLSESGLTDVLEGYLDDFMEKFKIVEHSGYVTGLEMESNPLATGISDSWTTAELQYWRIKAWIDPNRLAFLYMYGVSGLPALQNMSVFLDSFTFPE